MPTYEYACKQCGQHLEVVQRFTDDSLTDCPTCGGALRKVFSAPGISFKGSGFYKNDSRPSSGSSSGTTADSSKSNEAPSTDGGTGSTSSEQKPASGTKTESAPTAAPKTDTAAP